MITKSRFGRKSDASPTYSPVSPRSSIHDGKSYSPIKTKGEERECTVMDRKLFPVRKDFEFAVK